jgi:inosose dehydratase
VGRTRPRRDPAAGLVGALPDGFAGWLMVEVDRPDIADPYESAVAAAQWMTGRYGG